MQGFIPQPMVFYTDSESSDAPPVVFVHAFPFNHEMWASQAEVLHDRWRVVTYDVRGMGRSEPGEGAFTIDEYVDDLLLLLDTLKIERAAMVGLSMGGYILLRAHQRAAERFAALVLCSTRSEADDEAARSNRERSIEFIERHGLIPYADEFVKRAFAPQTFAADPHLIERQRDVIGANQPQGVIGALRALASRPDTTETLEQITVPTLLLYGEEDALTPPSIGRAMQDRIAGSEFHVIGQAAHLCNLEQPEPFNLHLIDFLEQQR